MAAFDFPASPVVNDLYTANGITYKWDGTVWNRIPSGFVNDGSFLYYTQAQNVGIGTATPSSKLTVQGTTFLNGNVTVTGNFTLGGTDFFVNDTNGRVGIGTVAPSQTFEVVGAAVIGQTVLATPTLSLTNSGGTTGAIIAEFKGDSDALQIQNTGVGDYTIYNTQQNNGIVIKDGIGGVELLYNNTTYVSATSTGVDLFTGATVNSNTIFHDTYHPNADTWTTGRTITLTGDVTGVSGSWDGSGNISFATTTAQSTSDFTVGGHFFVSTTGFVSAAGTTQATGTALTTTVNRITSITASSAEAVVMPGAVIGMMIVVYNDHATDTLQIFPAVGDKFGDGGVNTPISLVPDAMVQVFAINATRWVRS